MVQPAQGSYLRLETPGTPPAARTGAGAAVAAPRASSPEPEGCGSTLAGCGAALLQCLRGLCCGGTDTDSNGSPHAHERARHYRAPVVASPRRAVSGSSSGDGDHEHGTLLPKRPVPDAGGASSSAANAMELPRQRHAGGAGGHRGAWTPPPEPGPSGAAGGNRMRSPAPAGPSSSGRPAADSGDGGGGSGGAGAGSGVSSSSGARHARKLSREAMAAALAGAAAAAGDGSGKGGGGADSSAAAAARLALLLGAVEQDEDDDVCPTCLEVYTEDNPKIWTRCNHHFHMQCLYEWLERKETCPLCESVISFDGLTM